MNNKNNILYVGLDVHKNSITIVVFKNNENEPFIVISKRNEKSELKKYFKKLQERGVLVCCYEAGPTGFELYRFLIEIGIQCIIVAPGLLPKKPGNRIKNDKRDATNLAKSLRNGDVVSIHVPSQSDEAVRDYIRMRGDFKEDLKRKKQQLLNFLLRHDRKFNESRYWTLKHRKWIKAQEFKEELLKESLTEYYTSIVELEEKIKRLENKIEEIADKQSYRNDVSKLKCLKGIDTLTSLSFVVEISDFNRFSKAEQFMGFLGVTPSESTSGEKRRQGGITKCGNSHLRKLLIESSWHYRNYNPESIRLIRKRKNQKSDIIAYANKAGRRLNKKYIKMIYNGKNSKLTVTAVARELSGFIWGMMTNNID